MSFKITNGIYANIIMTAIAIELLAIIINTSPYGGSPQSQINKASLAKFASYNSPNINNPDVIKVKIVGIDNLPTGLPVQVINGRVTDFGIVGPCIPTKICKGD